MTDEELNRLEAVVRERAASGDIDPEPSLSLIALARVGLAVQPRPITEAPKDEYFQAVIYGGVYMTTTETFETWRPMGEDGTFAMWNHHRQRWEQDYSSYGYEEYNVYRPTHFIPLSALPKPGGE